MLHDAQAGTLTGHLARTNTQWRDTVGEVLVIVRGPDAYVSPSWYATRAEHGRVVRISRIVATWKTSQNRSAADVDGVVAGLSAQGEAAATAVRASHPGHRG